MQRQSMASMRPHHARTHSRFADSASRVSDEEGSRTAVKVGQFTHLSRPTGQPSTAAQKGQPANDGASQLSEYDRR